MSTVGALSALVAAIGVMFTSRKVDVLTGRVDEHGRLLQTIVTAMLSSPAPPRTAPPTHPSAVAAVSPQPQGDLPHG